MSLPIVFIHKGNSWYLPYTFYQAKYRNPSSKIYLLGDRDTLHFQGLINHVQMDTYSAGSKELFKVYKHKSTLSWDFEFFCISRWFVLYEFLRSNNIDQCLYIDSDVLLYCNATEEAGKLNGYSMTMPYDSAHTNFILNVEDLKLLCDMVIDLYKKNEEFLDQQYKEHMSHFDAGGISDMNFFRWFKKKYPGKIKDISAPERQSAYDITIDTTLNYETDGRIKKIKMKDKFPYCLFLPDQKWILFNTLHFQGISKRYIRQYFIFNTISFKAKILLKYYPVYIFQKVGKKVSSYF
jgi:hypothetical protein